METTAIRPVRALSAPELDLAIEASQWQRKYGEKFAELAKAKIRIAELEAEIERLKNPHKDVIPNFLERNWYEGSRT